MPMGLNKLPTLVIKRVKTLIALKMLESCPQNIQLTGKQGLHRLSLLAI
jgi:hypothetical protein